jgi:hypothetical protein
MFGIFFSRCNARTYLQVKLKCYFEEFFLLFQFQRTDIFSRKICHNLNFHAMHALIQLNIKLCNLLWRPIKSILISGQVRKKLSVVISRTNQFAHDYSGKVVLIFHVVALSWIALVYAYEIEKKLFRLVGSTNIRKYLIRPKISAHLALREVKHSQVWLKF